MSQSNVCDQARKNSLIEIEFGTDIKERLTARAAESETDPATLPRKRERAQENRRPLNREERQLLEDRKQAIKQARLRAVFLSEGKKPFFGSIPGAESHFTDR